MKQENSGKLIFSIGAIATIIALVGIATDVIIGNITGGDLSALPQTAAGDVRIHCIPFRIGHYGCK